MTYEEIFKKEERTNENIYLIHLYYEGMWWRAYEWSAYLCVNFHSSSHERLKPTKKKVKGRDDGMIFVGLQMISFKKYFPNIYENNKIQKIDDKHIILDVKDMFTNFEIENYQEILKEWKNSICESQKKTTENNINHFTQSFSQNINDILSEIANYQLANHTLLESTLFLSEIQKKIIKLK